ncbi:MAG: fluoride efflux transporter CrcB [Planctomycetota bacterium]|nr:fluoride efflux transporter CrcB [Planctomycetota bacterium]
MHVLVLVGLGGAVGALLRYGASVQLQSIGGTFPAATLVVNVIGCLAIGAALGMTGRATELPETWRLFLVVGLLGSLTTFSTFGKETVDLVVAGESGRALLVVAANLALGLPAVWLGARISA